MGSGAEVSGHAQPCVNHARPCAARKPQARIHKTLPCFDGSHEWDDEQRGHAEEWHDSSSASITVDFEKCLKCGR